MKWFLPSCLILAAGTGSMIGSLSAMYLLRPSLATHSAVLLPKGNATSAYACSLTLWPLPLTLTFKC